MIHMRHDIWATTNTGGTPKFVYIYNCLSVQKYKKDSNKKSYFPGVRKKIRICYHKQERGLHFLNFCTYFYMTKWCSCHVSFYYYYYYYPHRGSVASFSKGGETPPHNPGFQAVCVCWNSVKIVGWPVPWMARKKVFCLALLSLR